MKNRNLYFQVLLLILVLTIVIGGYSLINEFQNSNLNEKELLEEYYEQKNMLRLYLVTMFIISVTTLIILLVHSQKISQESKNQIINEIGSLKKEIEYDNKCKIVLSRFQRIAKQIIPSPLSTLEQNRYRLISMSNQLKEDLELFYADKTNKELIDEKIDKDLIDAINAAGKISDNQPKSDENTDNLEKLIEKTSTIFEHLQLKTIRHEP